MTKKKIAGGEFAFDLLSGMSDRQLMNKYGINYALSLYRVFKKMVNRGIITREHLAGRLPERVDQTWASFDPLPGDEQHTTTMLMRRVPRRSPFGRIEVENIKNSGKGYEILDISPQGLMIRGYKAKKGDIIEFVVRTLYLEDIEPIQFFAECRWTNRTTAGFRIVDITPGNKRALENFISHFTFEQL